MIFSCKGKESPPIISVVIAHLLLQLFPLSNLRSKKQGNGVRCLADKLKESKDSKCFHSSAAYFSRGGIKSQPRAFSPIFCYTFIMKKRDKKTGETYTSSDLKCYLHELRREHLEVMKTILSPQRFTTFRSQLLSFGSKVNC